MIRILVKAKIFSKPEKFRRAGFAFTREPRQVDVTTEELAILQAEPMLAVTVLEEPEKKLEEPEKKKAK